MATPTPFEQELLPWWCPKELEEDVAQCKTRLSLNILIVLSTVPLIVNALIPRRRVARALFPMWYHILWMLRIGILGVVGAFAAELVVTTTSRQFLYDFSIYSYICCLAIKGLHDIHMWDRMKTDREIGFVFWYCMLLNRITVNKFEGVRFIILQPDVLLPCILAAFEFIPFPVDRFLSFQSRGFLDDFGRRTLDDIHPAHLRYHPDDELIFLFRVRTGNRKEVLRCLQNAGPTVKILLNRSVTFWGNTALHIAYKRKDMEMVKLLLYYGADATILNDWDQPAIPAGELNLQQLHSAASDFSTLSVNTMPESEPLVLPGDKFKAV